MFSAYRESALVSSGDDAVRSILDVWHRLCRDVLGNDLAVAFASRYDHPEFSKSPGVFNTAIPLTLEEGPFLVLFLEGHKNFDCLMVTHEIGHVALKLQGFQPLRHRIRHNSPEALALIGALHHRALYALQRSVGHDPQHEVDDRARLNKKRVRASRQSADESENLALAYEIADDLLNCSRREYADLFTTVRTKRRDLLLPIEKIIDTASTADPGRLETYATYVDILKRELLTAGNWEDAPDVAYLRRFAAREFDI